MYEGVDLNHCECNNNTDPFLIVTVKPEGQNDIHRTALEFKTIILTLCACGYVPPMVLLKKKSEEFCCWADYMICVKCAGGLFKCNFFIEMPLRGLRSRKMAFKVLSVMKWVSFHYPPWTSEGHSLHVELETTGPQD